MTSGHSYFLVSLDDFTWTNFRMPTSGSTTSTLIKHTQFFMPFSKIRYSIPLTQSKCNSEPLFCSTNENFSISYFTKFRNCGLSL